MLQQSDKNECSKVMLQEVSVQEQWHHWTVVPQGAVPTTAELVILILTSERKLHLDGSLNKHKSRLCAHGGM